MKATKRFLPGDPFLTRPEFRMYCPMSDEAERLFRKAGVLKAEHYQTIAGKECIRLSTVERLIEQKVLEHIP